MKKLSIISLFILLLSSCEKVQPKYFDDISGVYFKNYASAGVLSDSREVTFAYIDGDEYDVEVSVQLLGRTSDEDRTVALEAYSEDADEKDYNIVNQVVIPAGETSFQIVLRLFRTADLKQTTKKVTLRLKENENFIIPFAEMSTSGGVKVAADTYTISFNDLFTVAPDGWESVYVGVFSQQKFELLCKVMQMSRSTFTAKGAISSARWIYIQTTMQQYIIEQQKLKDAGKDYDKQAFDSEGKPLSFVS